MELNLKELISSKEGRIYLVSGRERDVDIFTLRSLESCNSNNIVMRLFRGQRCTLKELLFQEFAAALQFPYYFGCNWDALDECIVDLSWLPATRYIFFITHIDKVLIDMPSDLHIFINGIIKDGVTEWNKENKHRPINNPVPFNIIFHCEPENKEKCKEILKKENIKPILRGLKPYDDIS